ncbi:hybrid sensor histidine kinase/response regulator [Mesoterricola silvestris]|uniref:histidine kinase n=1 Tax=Mesoterricola silvestris TaxID=2927979 RepID=A0AA48KAS6_9BACT|nr:PAS domain S-box protein [Mesoterricola silvestris]BDU73612.1 histidine kinase [Mesoterricola silvestris]
MFSIGPPLMEPSPGGAPLDYALILDALPDAVLIHDAVTGRILEVNRACLEMFGHSPEAMAGLDLEMLSAAEEGYTLAEAQVRIRESLARGRVEFPWRSRRADGSFFWSEVRLTTAFGRVIAVVRDVTAAAQAEEALKLAEDKFERIFRSNPSSILLGRYPDGEVEEVNDTLLALTGYGREEIIGRSSAGFWAAPEDRERYLERLRAQGHVKGLEARFRTRSGEILVGRVSGDLLNLAAGLRILTVIEDITARKAYEDALGRASRLYAALSLVNQSIIRVQTPQELFQCICRDLVAGGGFWGAWIAEPDARTGRFRALAFHGGREGWVEGLEVYATDDRPEGRGTMGRAFRTGVPVLAYDFSEDPGTAPWHDAGAGLGFKAAGSFPLRRGDGVVFGVLAIYAEEAGFFGPQEITLLEEVCKDITYALEDLDKEERRKRAEAEQGRLRELLQSIIDSTPDLIYAKDPAGGFLLANRAMAGFIGREPGEIIGRTAAGLWTAPVTPALLAILQDEAEAFAGKVVTREVALPPPMGGDERILDTLQAPLRDAQGRIEGVLGYARDITPLRRQEEQQRALELRLQQSQKLESLGNLAGGVAHDLNNVLGAILGLASLEAERDPGNRSMETIRKACVRGRGVVQGLLCFARRDLGEILPVNLNRQVEEIVELLSRTTLQRIRFVTDLAPDLRAVEGDPGALNHAIMNICVNSLDAMPQGGTITLRTANAPGGEVVLDVEDTGEGMSEDVVERATEPFFTTKPAGKGTGLGLAMVYGTVEAHRGTLTLASRPGEGTQVRLSFPGSEARPAESAPAPQEPPARGLRVLLVDDDELLRESVTDVLHWQGHQVTCVEGGLQALDALADPAPFDLVILDLNMPGMTGDEALPRILALRPGQRILVSSGHVDAAARALVEGLPTVGLLHKPFSVQELARKIRELGWT